MTTLILSLLTLMALLTVMRREAGAFSGIIVMAIAGLVAWAMASKVLAIVLFIAVLVTAVSGLPIIRRLWLSPIIFEVFKKVAPKVSETEQVALDAGTVGWDAELFSGKPDWNKLLDNPYSGLTSEEQAFVDKQCVEVLSQCNAWDISVERADLPLDVWNYLKKEGFFGMIIPKEYGGLGFSAKAQTAVLQKLSANEMLMINVGVPNSLGRGEPNSQHDRQWRKTCRAFCDSEISPD